MAVMPTDALVTRLERLRVAVLADVLLRLGYRDQVMRGVRPLPGQEMVSFAGSAFPIQVVATHEQPDDPYAAEIEAVDAVPAGAVLCFAAAGATDAAVWGELLATRAKAKGAVGAAIDGAARDIVGLLDLGFPTFASEISANDAFGRAMVASFGSPVVCGGIAVRANDLILADPDGVVVIPADASEDAIGAAETKSEKEEAARADLQDGGTIEETYARYNTL
jgi:4-hydroxy-4-methyl-2-oxoglutarate aldolase